MDSSTTKKSSGGSISVSKAAKQSPNPSVSTATTKKGPRKPVPPPKPKLPSSTPSPQPKKSSKDGCSKKVLNSSPATKNEPIELSPITTTAASASFLKSRNKAPKLQKSYSISGSSPKTSVQGERSLPRTPEGSSSKRQPTPTPSTNQRPKLSRANSIDLKNLHSTTSNNKLVSIAGGSLFLTTSLNAEILLQHQQQQQPATCREVSFAMPEISQIIRRPPSSQSEGELNSRSGELPELNSIRNNNNKCRETDQNQSLLITSKLTENQSLSQRLQRSAEPAISISTVDTTVSGDMSHQISKETDNIYFIDDVVDQASMMDHAVDQWSQVSSNPPTISNPNSSFNASSLNHREEQLHSKPVSSSALEPYDRRTCDRYCTTVSISCYPLNRSQISTQTQSVALARSSFSSAAAAIEGLDRSNYDSSSQQPQEQWDPVRLKGSSGRMLSPIGRRIQQASNKNQNTLRSSVSQDSPFHPPDFSPTSMGTVEDRNWNYPVAYHYNPYPNAFLSSYGEMHSSRSYEYCNTNHQNYPQQQQQQRYSPNFYFHNHLGARQQPHHQKRHNLIYQHHPVGGSLQFYPTSSSSTHLSNNDNNVTSSTAQQRRGRFVKSQSLGSASACNNLNTINEHYHHHHLLGRQHYSSTVTVNQDDDDDDDVDEDDDDENKNNDDQTNQSSGRQPRQLRRPRRRRHKSVQTEKYYFGWWLWESETLNRLIHQRNLRDAAKQCCLESRGLSSSTVLSSSSQAHPKSNRKLPKKEEFTEWDNRTGTLTFNTFKPDASRTSLDNMKMGIGIDNHEVMNGNRHSTTSTGRGGREKTDNYYSTNIHDIIRNDRIHSEFASQMPPLENQGTSTSTSAQSSDRNHHQQQQQQPQPPWYHTAGSHFESYNSLNNINNNNNNNTHSSFQTATTSPSPPPLPTCQPPPLSSSDDINQQIVRDDAADDPKINRVHQYRNVVPGSRPLVMSAANSLPAISAAANPNPAEIEHYNSVQLAKSSKFHHRSSGGAAYTYYEPILNINLLEGESRVGFSMTGGVGESLPSLVNQIIKGSPADRGRLLIGDEILEVNGVNVEAATHSQIVRHIHQCIRSKTIQLRVRRRQEEESFYQPQPSRFTTPRSASAVTFAADFNSNIINPPDVHQVNSSGEQQQQLRINLTPSPSPSSDGHHMESPARLNHSIVEADNIRMKPSQSTSQMASVNGPPSSSASTNYFQNTNNNNNHSHGSTSSIPIVHANNNNHNNHRNGINNKSHHGNPAGSIFQQMNDNNNGNINGNIPANGNRTNFTENEQDRLYRLKQYEMDFQRQETDLETTINNGQQFPRPSCRGSNHKQLQGLADDYADESDRNERNENGLINPSYTSPQNNWPKAKNQHEMSTDKRPLGLNEVLESVDEVTGALNQHEYHRGDSQFIRRLFDKGEVQNAIGVTQAVLNQHQSVPGKNGFPQSQNSLNISDSVLERLRTGSPGEGEETSSNLQSILEQPHVQALLYTHDQIASENGHAQGTSQQRWQQQEHLPQVHHSPSATLGLKETVLHGTDSGNLSIIKLIKNDDHYLGATVKTEKEKIVIGRIIKGGVADKSKLLREGDEIWEVNGHDLRGRSVNEVCDLLKNMTGELSFIIRPVTETNSSPASNARPKTEIRHMRALFDYEPDEDLYVPCRELALKFQKRDVLHVISMSDPQWWQGFRDGDEPQQNSLAGLIPSSAFHIQREMYRRELLGEISAANEPSKNSSQTSSNQNRSKSPSHSSKLSSPQNNKNPRMDEENDENEDEENRTGRSLICGKRSSKSSSSRNSHSSNPKANHYNNNNSTSTNSHQKERNNGLPNGSLATDEIAPEDQILTYEEVVLHLPRPGQKRPIVMVGPPNVGCLELRQKLMENEPDKFSGIVPHTSRPKRSNEVDGLHYHFVSKQRFQEDAIKPGRFIEWGEWERHLFGTSTESIRLVVDRGLTAMLTLKPQSLRAMRDTGLMPFVVFVCPQSLERLRINKQRNANTATLKDEDLKNILREAQEMEEGYGHLFDKIIYVTDLDSAYAELRRTIHSLETEPHWIPIDWLPHDQLMLHKQQTNQPTISSSSIFS